MSIPSSNQSIPSMDKTIEDIDSKLQEMEKKLTPCGTILGHIIRKLQAGIERISRRIDTKKSMSRQEASFENLQTLYNKLKDRFSKEIQNYSSANTTEGQQLLIGISEEVKERLEKMNKICGMLLIDKKVKADDGQLVEKKVGKKIDTKEVNDMMTEIEETIKSCDQEIQEAKDKIKLQDSTTKAQQDFFNMALRGDDNKLLSSPQKAQAKFKAIYRGLENDVIQNINVQPIFGKIAQRIRSFDDNVESFKISNIRDCMIDFLTVYRLLDKNVPDNLFEID